MIGSANGVKLAQRAVPHHGHQDRQMETEGPEGGNRARCLVKYRGDVEGPHVVKVAMLLAWLRRGAFRTGPVLQEKGAIRRPGFARAECVAIAAQRPRLMRRDSEVLREFFLHRGMGRASTQDSILKRSNELV